ncbi:inositol oxygenase [Lingula anatina]|uniref:Inositol oxygenase n=1 Tax=Lingula anatina TaxID=7574 RepID=A0A1S3HX42_LINAN|nr:inositol oxygenase [Lingula anatina]|eukprot:XP_013389634.1 inositol oxygenase [Lingula anatina]
MTTMAPCYIIDPSDKYRPDHKGEEQFRNYEGGEFIDRVRKTYSEIHSKQCVESVINKVEYWTKFDRMEMTILEAVEALNALVDESDPDFGLPNAIHAFQTAERIRQAHPDLDWFHLTGLIHDLGKVMALWGEPQCFVVGDTFPVGCAFSDKIVFGRKSFENNPDINNPLYNTKLGMYAENCGLDKVIMSWGHDEYMYRVLLNHEKCSLPQEALYMVRFHSFYPWHTGKDYNYLCNEQDMKMTPWITEFNKFDLYSKSEVTPDVESLIPYYQSLIEKYVPGKLKW